MYSIGRPDGGEAGASAYYANRQEARMERNFIISAPTITIAIIMPYNSVYCCSRPTASKPCPRIYLHV